ELVVFIGFRSGSIELTELKGDQLESRIAALCCAPHSSHFVLTRAPRVERGRDRCGERLERAERVEHAEMRRRIEQCLVLMLTVELDQPRRQILQRACCGESVVDEGATAALRRDFAANQQ